MRRLLLCGVVTGLLAGAQVFTQAPPAKQLIIKEAAVTLTLPYGTFGYSGYSAWSGRSTWSADGTLEGEHVKWMNGRDENFFPIMCRCTIKNIDRKKDHFELELRGEGAQVFKISLFNAPSSADVERAARDFLLPGWPPNDVSTAYLIGLYSSMARRWFTGPLASIDSPTQIAFVRFAHESAKGINFKTDTYKSNLYFAVDLGEPDPLYNDLKLNQAARVARVLNDELLSTIKTFAKAVDGDIKNLYGLKLERRIMHRDFLKGGAPEKDALVIYAPIELIRKFADADITSQQFIDGCVVIVNDNRIAVPLAAS